MSEYGPGVVFDDPAFVHDSAMLYGNVRVGRNASIWPRVVARAEVFEVKIGEYVNIQDFVMIHVGATTGTHIGAHCSITHHSTVHGCSIGDNCLIGINATVMDGVVIGENSIVGAHCVLPPGTVIPPNSIVAGVPGKVIKERNNFIDNRINAFVYYRNALAFARGEHREWSSDAYHAALVAERAKLDGEYAARYEAGAA